MHCEKLSLARGKQTVRKRAAFSCAPNNDNGYRSLQRAERAFAGQPPLLEWITITGA